MIEGFPFLRPWFLLFLLAPLFMRRIFAIQSDFERVVEPPFWKMFKISVSDFYRKGHSFFRMLAYILFVVALSGPFILRSSESVFSEKKGAVIVWDASFGNIRQKEQGLAIMDALKELKDVEVGFVIYDEYPYLVSPLSKDHQLILQNLFQISPTVMPSPRKSDAAAAVAFARRLIKDSGFSGGKVYLFSSDGFTVSGSFSSETLREDGAVRTPVDLGVYFLLIGVFILVLSELLRRIAYLFCFILLCLSSFSAHASSYEADWEGVKAYRAGDYIKAADYFKGGQGKDARYNLGNALAKSGRIEAAIAAYESFLKDYPGDADAKFNLDYLKKQTQKNQDNPPSSSSQETEDEREDGSLKEEKTPMEKQLDSSANKEATEEDLADTPHFIDAPTKGDQWLYRVPDQPLGLLKERLRRQYLKQGGKKQ